ncbi:MAG: polynucleotide adenylyltransferase PcnB [Pseudomonadota bacterium]
MLQFLKKVFHKSSESEESTDTRRATPTVAVIPRAEHGISRTQINEYALKVLYRLKDRGFEAYLVGGCVRDLLLGVTPKDFDVVTNALPEEVRSVFKNCRLIGRRFRLAHVYFGEEIIEVATFRGRDTGDVPTTDHGRVLRDNAYGVSIEEDAERRDFTANALYYNIRDFSVIDFQNGWDDLCSRELRVIGDPEQRFREDPVRMLRAIRFATKLGFTIEPNAAQALKQCIPLLSGVSSARLFDELLKLFMLGKSEAVWPALKENHILPILLPAWAHLNDAQERYVMALMHAMDARVAEGKHVSVPFFWAALMWTRLSEKTLSNLSALEHMIGELFAEQCRIAGISQRIIMQVRDILALHFQLQYPRRGRCERCIEHSRYRAAYDLLLLRAQAGDTSVTNTIAWWTSYAAGDEPARIALEARLPAQRRRKSRS